MTNPTDEGKKEMKHRNDFLDFIKEDRPGLLKPIKKKVEYNLAKLLQHDLTHGEAIWGGHAFEQYVRMCIKNSKFELSTLRSVNLSTNKGKTKKKEVDILFTNSKLGYYFEIKSNVNLDSEKNPTTFDKLKPIMDKIHEEYPNLSFQNGILVPWFEYENDMPYNYKNPKITFMSNFFKILELNLTKKEYERDVQECMITYIETKRKLVY